MISNIFCVIQKVNSIYIQQSNEEELTIFEEKRIMY